MLRTIIAIPSKEVLLIETEKRSDMNETTSKRLPVSLHLWMSVLLSLSGYVTPQKSGVGIITCYLLRWNPSTSLIVMMRRSHLTQSQASSLMPLAISFDNHVGHDYLQDYESRYELPQEGRQD